MSITALEELAALRGEIEEITRGAGQISLDPTEGGAGVSYSFGIVSSVEEKAAQVAKSIKETLAKLAPVAHFQTTVDGFTATTVIHYSGLTASVWSGGTTAELVEAHLESLRRLYAFRTAVTAVVAAIGNAVVAISIAVGNPLTVWRAVQSAEALKSAVERLASAAANAGTTQARD